MTRKLRLSIPLLLLALCLAPVRAGAVADEISLGSLDLARKQFRQFSLGDAPLDFEQAAGFAAGLRQDGSWPDIDYASRHRAGWRALEHLARVLGMTKAAGLAASDSRQVALLQAVHRALAYWCQHDLQSPNWWHNRIGAPQKLGEIALLLDHQLRPEEFSYITQTVMPRTAVGRSTAQNRVWLAGCALMDGLIRREDRKVAESAAILFAEAAVVAGKEGIQADFSFHQHGPQQQFGAYGLSFAADQVRWLAVLRGTPWAMSPAQEDVLRRYFLNGLNWVAWRGALDISSCGRQFEPNFSRSRAGTLAGLMTRMSTLDPAHSGEYLAFVKRNAPNGANDLVGCRFFWRSDYLVQRRKDFCFTLKMSSPRVIGSESLNGQNLSGYYLADGAAYLYRAGDEYQGILPVWDWRKLPGVTCPQTTGPLPRFSSYKLESLFAGAVTDGTNACAVLDYRRDGVSARKAWFLHQDQIVCLGSRLRVSAQVQAPLATTINQCRLRGTVRINDGKSEKVLEPGTHAFEDLRWVEHDGVRYLFPYPQHVRVSNQRRTGNWKTVALSGSAPSEDVAEGVFTLSLEHGLGPTNATYACCICPTPQAACQPYAIVTNSEPLQAVRFGDKLVEAVFHAPGRLNGFSGHRIAVDAPCVALFNLSDQGLQATVADPAQSLKQLGLDLDGTRSIVQLPAGIEAGKSIRCRRAESN